MFLSEKEMSVKFEKFLKANFGNAYFKEHKWLFWIPDFVFYSKGKEKTSIVSFELKLKNWQQAAKQAFRYKSFSDISYVVLESSNIKSALCNISLFEQYNIGLASFGLDETFEIVFQPEARTPYSDVLSGKMLEKVVKCRKKSKILDNLSLYVKV